ncbi:MAG: NHL repeat-containing protein [Planctomycetota bacterium]
MMHRMTLPFALCLFALPSVTAKPDRVVTLAGSGDAKFANGTGTKAGFNQPFGMCADAKGNLYVADSGNHCIRKVTPSGVVTTWAGTGQKGTADGPAKQVRFDTPSGVLLDGKGNLLVCSYVENTIRRVDSKGNSVSLIPHRDIGYRDGPAGQARIFAPRGMALDPKGNLFFTDCWNHRIRKLSKRGVVSTIAGGGPTGIEAKATWRDGKGTEARFYAPCGLAIDRNGNLFVADAENHRIRKIAPDGVVTTIAGHGPSGKPGRAFADGPSARSRLNTPTEVVVSDDGTVYFSDTYGNRIRRIFGGVVSTIAGSGEAGSRDDILGRAQLNFPRGLVVRKRTFHFVDYNNHTLRSFRLSDGTAGQ